jgi:hypothetical protein
MGGGMGGGSMARNRSRKKFMAFPWQMFLLVSILQQTFIGLFARFIATHASRPGCICI